MKTKREWPPTDGGLFGEKLEPKGRRAKGANVGMVRADQTLGDPFGHTSADRLLVSISMVVPSIVRRHLDRLRDTGLYGRTTHEVAERLLCERLRELLK